MSGIFVIHFIFKEICADAKRIVGNRMQYSNRFNFVLKIEINILDTPGVKRVWFGSTEIDLIFLHISAVISN